MKSYRDLDIYNMAYKLAYEINKMTKTLPKFEFYEQGSQIRRSSQSIKDNIVEGFGRRRYKAEFIRYLIFAQASCDETLNQLCMIKQLYYNDGSKDQLIADCDNLGKKLNKFIQYVESSWKTRNH